MSFFAPRGWVACNASREIMLLMTVKRAPWDPRTLPTGLPNGLPAATLRLKTAGKQGPRGCTRFRDVSARVGAPGLLPQSHHVRGALSEGLGAPGPSRRGGPAAAALAAAQRPRL